MSEADVGGLAVEVEPSHQYSPTFCCCVTDGSRVAYEAKAWNWIPPCWKNGTHWHSLMLADCLWRSNRGCEHSEAAGGAFWQWWQWQWVSSIGADFYKHSTQALGHCWWKGTTNGGDCVEKECLLNSVTVHFVIASVEISRRHYFWSDLHIFDTFSFHCMLLQC